MEDKEDFILGDNGEFILTKRLPARPTTTAFTAPYRSAGGADKISGNVGNDIILGGVNGSSDVLVGGPDDDIILGDNGELIYDDPADPDLATLAVVRSFLDARGGADEISGDAGRDIILGGTGGDTLYGDDDSG